MTEEVVNLNTELICNNSVDNLVYLFLKEVTLKRKKVVTQISRAAHPCQKYILIKEARKTFQIFIYKKVRLPTLVINIL